MKTKAIQWKGFFATLLVLTILAGLFVGVARPQRTYADQPDQPVDIERPTPTLLVDIEQTVEDIQIADSPLIVRSTGISLTEAISTGVAYLASQQNPDGSWNTSSFAENTCLALTKFEERAYELEYDSPFDPTYPYSQTVIDGWTYLFTTTHFISTTIVSQTHGAVLDDPDTNGNGFGIYANGNYVYATGVCLMALASTDTPNRVNEGGLDFDGVGGADTYLEIAQEMIDWLAYAQADNGNGEGGWYYTAQNNGSSSDQSNAGFATLGLAFADQFGATVPDWVKTELNKWITYIQCATPGGQYGAAGYTAPCAVSYNPLYRTAHLIFQMTFIGEPPSSQRYENALSFIEDHWQDTGSAVGDTGWGYNSDPAQYLATYVIEKGFTYAGIKLIDTDGDGQRDDEWFNQEPAANPPQDLATAVILQQEADDSWPDNCAWGNDILCTILALFTIEKSAPESPTQPLGDFVWNDSNGDGIQDAGEAGVADVDVDLYDNGTCTGVPTATTTTNAFGIYGFSEVVSGTYCLEFDVPTNYAVSPADQGGDDTKDSDANAAGLITNIVIEDGVDYPNEDMGISQSADLSISKSVEVKKFTEATFTIVAQNSGPSAAHGAVVSDTMATTSFISVTWTCSASGGAACGAASGTDSISDTLSTFPAGGVVTYTVQCTLVDWSIYENVAEVIAPSGILDTDTSNNRAVYKRYQLLFPVIYRNWTP